MKKTPAEPTGAGNLEAKFDRGEDVLDYFDTRQAKVIPPRNRAPAQYLVELPAGKQTVVGEPAGSYPGGASRQSAMAVGIPWYRREQWARWKEISLDRAEMCQTYDEWLEKAEHTIRNFTKDAVVVHKVDVDVEEFLNWATKQDVAITGVARADFANLKLGKREMKRLTPSDTPFPNKAELKQTMRKAKGMDLSEIWEPYLRRPKAAICPIFRQTDEGPEQIGSGVLLQVADAHFLLTAAHVTDERRTKPLLIPAKTGFVNLFGLFIESPMPHLGSRKDDKLDVAVVKLSQDLVARLHDHLLFLDHGDCNLADVTEPKDVYTIIGYPAKKSGIDGNAVVTDQFSLSGDGVLDYRFEELGLDPRRHIIVQLRMKRTIHYSNMLKRQPPHPEGMSGGGIFAWDKALPELSALGQPKLVGILTEYHQHKNVFVGTRLHAHVMAIHKSDPTLPIVPIREN
jgi:hypothetical protein